MTGPASAVPEAVPCDDSTEDAFLGGRFILRQPARGLRAGSDAMLLAAAVPAAPGDRLIEAGIGTGAAALAVLARQPGVTVTGLEVDPTHAALARHNAAANVLAHKVTVVETDVTGATATSLRARGVVLPFDHAFANPPYFETARSREPDDAGRRIARMTGEDQLDLWIARLADLVRGGGTVTVIHRVEALGALFAALDGRLGGVVVLPLSARKGNEATRIIVQATKGSRSPLRLLSPLVLHQDDGAPTYQARAILHDAARLDLAPTPSGTDP